MKPIFAGFTLLFLIGILFIPIAALAHGGGLNKQGCHNNRQTGDYHCHRGAKAEPKKPSKPTLSGVARIIDGDTIRIGDIRIRLHGIDAPETRQECQGADGASYRCGEASTEALRTLIGADPVRCEGTTYDRYKRLIATCYSGRVNLNAEMVRQGWALAYRRYSKDYVSVEKGAQEAKRGIWAGVFEPPWKWRRK
jgi:endonuclease YncB( thermonuclease family)